MNTSCLSLFFVAVPPIVGSFIVLGLADVGLGVWITHLLAIFLACCLGLAGCFMSKPGNHQNMAFVVVILSLIGLAIPLFGSSTGPERWIPAGQLRLYAAPLLLPSFIAAFSVFIAKDGKYQIMSLAAVLVAAFLLALQPDASQILGLLVASAVVIVQYRLGILCFNVVVVPLALVTMWAFYLPDPLTPLPHVEEVFALAFDHSLFAGVAVIASALALIVGLWIKSVSGSVWLSAVAAYYMVLFLCSTAGITPAPLVGYGAGPILGFGLMVGLAGWFKHQNRPNEAIGQLRRDMVKRSVTSAVLISLAAASVGAIIMGSPWLETRLPGGLPFGNLIAALALSSIAGAALSLCPPTGLVRRLSQVVLAASVSWLPVSIVLAGNLSLNFANERGDTWQYFTGIVLLTSLLMLMVAAVLRVVAKFARRKSA